MKVGAVEELIYSYIEGLDGRIPHCKLSIHANCFNEIQKSMIHHLGCRRNCGSNRLERLKSCCHHSLRDMCVHRDGAWWKLKKYCHWKYINDYPDGCLICMKSFYVCIVSPVDPSIQIMKMKGNENEKEINNCMVCSIQVFSFFDLGWSLNLCSFATYHILFFDKTGDMHPSIQVSKAIVFKHQLLFHWHYIFHFHFFESTGPSVTS